MSAREPVVVDAAMVKHLAGLLGLELTPEQLPGVVANLQRTAALAQTLAALPLDPEQEAGPIWRP